MDYGKSIGYDLAALKVLQTIRKYIVRILVLFLASTILTTLLYTFLPVPITPFMVIQYYSDHPHVFKKNWVPMNEISQELSLAVIASEDQLFLQHFGFDIEAIKKAMDYNERHNNKRIKGASTISQQTAKNVFLWPSRTWFRKGLEIYFTGLIELLWTKQRILEVYLNVIQMGKGIYGAQAASQYYFHKDASRLNSYEAALLAAILPNPEKFSAKTPSPYIIDRQEWILAQMRHLRTGDYTQLLKDEPDSGD